jgi:nucleotide-binding universal stress UspA family protein
LKYDRWMIKPDRILHPTDFSPASAPALDRAIFLAQLFSAELHLLHAIVLPSGDLQVFPDRQAIEDRLIEIAGKDLEGLVAPEKARDMVLVRSRRRGFSAGAVICEYCAEFEVDLVVMGTHGRRGAGRLLLGSVAGEVVHGAPCAVATVPASSEIQPPRKLLVPVDFSEHSMLAVGHALELAALTDGHVDLVHVVEHYRFPPFYTSGVEEALPPNLLELRVRAEAAMATLLSEVEGPDAGRELHVVTGRAPTAIVDLARNLDTDMIVMASHGISSLERGLLGSVAERIVRTAPCIVLTLKPHGRHLLR